MLGVSVLGVLVSLRRLFFPGLCRGVQNKRVLHTQGHATCSAQFNFLSRCFLCLVTESLTTKLLQRLFELLLFRSLTDVAMLTAMTADTANFLPAPAHSARTVSSSDGRKHFHSESILCLPRNARFFSVNDFSDNRNRIAVCSGGSLPSPGSSISLSRASPLVLWADCLHVDNRRFAFRRDRFRFCQLYRTSTMSMNVGFTSGGATFI